MCVLSEKSLDRMNYLARRGIVPFYRANKGTAYNAWLMGSLHCTLCKAYITRLIGSLNCKA
jgi:hypothetical protein